MYRRFAAWIVIVLMGVYFPAAAVFAANGTGTQQSLDHSMFAALRDGDVDWMGALRDKGANINVTLGDVGLDALDTFGPVIKPLLETNADINNWTLLFWAVYLQKEDVIRVLLRSGAVVNVSDLNGTMPLHWAAWSGNYPIVKTLLENGANPNVRDKSGRTPFDWALMTGQTDVIRLLPRESPQYIDEDMDGVPDDIDKCLGTPYGATVDERGCWIAAFSPFFDFDKAVVKKKYYGDLRKTAKVINANPNIRILLAGHTDNVGKPEYNMDLGLRRAKAVRDILVRYGVDKNRLTVKSFGETEPVASNDTAEGRARNRRVEVRVLD